MNFKAPPVDFNATNHTYTLNTGINKGKLVPGVTTITQPVGFPSSVASAWAAKEAIAYLNARIGTRKSVSTKVLKKWLPEAKGAYKRKSTEAADFGTEAHDWIEQWVKGRLMPEGSAYYPDAYPESEEAKQAVRAFLAWEEEHQPFWYASELVVGSLEYEFGGKLDALAMIDDKLTLVDFKTSNRISDSYFLQTAGYALALSEMGCDVEQRLILRIDKQGKGFEAVIVPTPIDLDTQTFVALRQVQKWTSYVTNN